MTLLYVLTYWWVKRKLYLKHVFIRLSHGHRYTQAGLGVFKSADMMSVRFRDLTLRVGLPYLYKHQGDCEHLVIFNEIR